MAHPPEETSNPISQGIQFTQESWEEIKKVHPPTREETIRATIVVIVMIAFFAIFLGLADLVVGRMMQSVLT